MRYGRGPMNKFNYAATLAASLAALCVKQRDAVGMAVFDDQERVWLRPIATNMQLSKIIDVLERARPDRTTELGSVMMKVADQIHSRGVVCIISDLLCDLDAFYAALGRMQFQGHEIIIFHVLDKDEIELPFNDSVLFKDIEGNEELFAEPWAFRKAYKAAMEKFIDEVAERCRFAGIDPDARPMGHHPRQLRPDLSQHQQRSPARKHLSADLCRSQFALSRERRERKNRARSDVLAVAQHGRKSRIHAELPARRRNATCLYGGVFSNDLSRRIVEGARRQCVRLRSIREHRAP
jgi:uncharacterized protein (DUF58 family)